MTYPIETLTTGDEVEDLIAGGNDGFTDRLLQSSGRW
jgi:hypothetical protein